MPPNIGAPARRLRLGGGNHRQNCAITDWRVAVARWEAWLAALLSAGATERQRGGGRVACWRVACWRGGLPMGAAGRQRRLGRHWRGPLQ